MQDEERAYNRFLIAYSDDCAAARARIADDYQRQFPAANVRIAAFLRAAAAPAAPSGSGRKIGPYRIERLLGRGGQGRVYLAVDERLGRRVALKVASSAFLLDAEDRERFQREATIAARLNHPGLVTIYDASSEGETPYIAMRYVEGPTLTSIIADQHAATASDSRGTRSRIDRALAVVEDVARALHAAHEAGVLHRDVKPGNIVVEGGERPVVVDFGLAHGGASLATLTSGVFDLGTAAYVAPERMSTASKNLDRRIDVYALGIVLYEWIAGRRPFAGESPAALLAQAEEGRCTPLHRIPGVSADCATVVGTAMAAQRDDRYATALELADDLARLRRSEPIHARPPSTTRRLGLWYRRRRALAHAALLAAALAGAAYYFRGESESRRGENDALVLETELERTIADAQGVGVRIQELPQRGMYEFAQINAMLQICARADKIAPFAALRAAEADRRAFENETLGRSDAELSRMVAVYAGFTAFVESLGKTLPEESPRAALLIRRRFLTEIRDRSIDLYTEEWSRTRRELAAPEAASLYGGVAITPQPGFLPLGKNPLGCFEFLDLWTREDPLDTAPPTARQLADPGFGVVYVLVPAEAGGDGSAFFIMRRELTPRLYDRLSRRGCNGPGNLPGLQGSPDSPVFAPTANIARTLATRLWARLPFAAERRSAASFARRCGYVAASRVEDQSNAYGETQRTPETAAGAGERASRVAPSGAESECFSGLLDEVSEWCVAEGGAYFLAGTGESAGKKTYGLDSKPTDDAGRVQRPTVRLVRPLSP